jgi:hypothetical protein
VVARRTILLAIGRIGSPGIRGSGYTPRRNVVFLATRNITADPARHLHVAANSVSPAGLSVRVNIPSGGVFLLGRVVHFSGSWIDLLAADGRVAIF